VIVKGLLNTPVLVTAVIVSAIGCAGAEKQKPHATTPDPAADPSSHVTMHSASDPNRNGSNEDLGRAGTNKLLVEVNDCDLTDCTVEPSPQLVDSVRTRAAEARSCYEEALKSTATLAGRIVVSFRVTHEGAACPIKFLQNELASSNTLEPCIRTLLERSYPKPKGGCVDFNLPLKFVPEYIEPDAGTTSGAKSK
jgi:hypothetical protein